MMMMIVHATRALPAMTPADREFLDGIGGAADARSGLSDSTMWAIALAGAGALVLAWIIVAAIRRDRARHGPAVRLIARGLGLRGTQLRLLREVARAAGVREVGSLLVSRGCFDRAVERYVARHGRAPQLAAIRRTIFDD
ncbi:MAG: hypothetical protein SYC29_06410 [Planctomycetota bacterium]|nr:hypothetical protein [Planctomycetota bacterium]